MISGAAVSQYSIVRHGFTFITGTALRDEYSSSVLLLRFNGLVCVLSFMRRRMQL
jgi:hypothetical protein